jgi:hypothetical protein
VFRGALCAPRDKAGAQPDIPRRAQRALERGHHRREWSVAEFPAVCMALFGALILDNALELFQHLDSSYRSRFDSSISFLSKKGN